MIYVFTHSHLDIVWYCVLKYDLQLRPVVAQWYKLAFVIRQVVGSIFTWENEIFYIFTFLTRPGDEVKCDVEFRHSERDILRIRRKVWNESVLTGIEYLNTRFPGFLFLPYTCGTQREAKKKEKKNTLNDILFVMYILLLNYFTC